MAMGKVEELEMLGAKKSSAIEEDDWLGGKGMNLSGDGEDGEEGGW